MERHKALSPLSLWVQHVQHIDPWVGFFVFTYRTPCGMESGGVWGALAAVLPCNVWPDPQRCPNKQSRVNVLVPVVNSGFSYFINCIWVNSFLKIMKNSRPHPIDWFLRFRTNYC